MSAARMNLFKGVRTKEKSRARVTKPTKLSPHLIAGLVILAGGTFVFFKSGRLHKERLATMRAEMVELEAQIQEVVAMSEQAKAARKPAGSGSALAVATKPSGMDGSWTAVLWKFAAFTGQNVVIREMQLAPLANGGKIQSVAIRGQATSLVEMREWLQRLIENMPGSEFSISNQRLGEGDFPVDFTLQAQVI